MRVAAVMVTLGLLGACSPRIPDSAAGVGFDNSLQAQRAREAALAHGVSVTGDPLIPPGALSSETIPPADTDPIADPMPVAAAPDGAPPSPPVSPPSAPAAAAGAAGDAADIARATAAALAASSAGAAQAAPGAAPDLAAYARKSANPVGNRIYSRTGFNLQPKAQRNCARYPSPDQAQIAFLAAGGPQSDRLGLDPDGDGYACSWDPAPFRAAKN